MNGQRVDFSSRISLRAVGAGIVVAIALNSLIMSPAAWQIIWGLYEPHESELMDARFWLLATMAWVVSIFIGAWVASVALPAEETKNAILNAFVTWAGAYLISGGLIFTLTSSQVEELYRTPQGLYMREFIGDVLALVAALAAGVLSSKYRKVRVRKKIHFYRRGGQQHATQI